MLRKEKEGSLYKFTKTARVAGVPKGRWERDMEAGVKVDPGFARHESLQSELTRVSPGLFRKGNPARAAAIRAELSELVQKAKTAYATTTPHYSEVDPKISGPAKSKRRKGDVPSRDDIPGRVTVEESQNITQSTIHPTEHFRAPEGFGGF